MKLANRHLLFIIPLLALVLTGCGGVSSSDSKDLPVIPEADSTLVNLTSGFNIAAKGADPIVHEVSTITDASKAVSLATLQHYTTVNIKFAFANSVTKNSFIDYYLELDTYTVVSSSNYATGTNVTNTFAINYYYSNAASYHTSQTSSSSYSNVTNVAQVIRLANQNRRTSGFDSFPIDGSNKGSLDVYNSEELWWAVSNNYVPNFPLANSRVEKIYRMARNVCRYYVNDEMNNMEKMRALYEWIVCQNKYDYASNDDSYEPWQNNICYYLEGLFEYGIAVCDSFSKTYALLCGIENLNVVRSYGYDSTDGGHAWNYGAPDDSTYYLICSTWGQFDKKVETIKYGMCDYKPFLTKQSYFSDNSDYNFIERIYPDLTKSNSVYSPSIFTLDTLPNSNYDYQIDSQAELNAIIKAYADTGTTGRFAVQVTAGDVTPSLSMMQTAVSEAGLTNNKGITAWSDGVYYKTYNFLIK